MLLYSPTAPASYTIGGKATGLYRLRQLKLAVPDFMVIPAEAFDALLSEEEKNEQVKERLLRFRLPEKELGRLKSILKSWNFPETAAVVRSSVAGEDGAENAFPGMMDSFLNLKTAEDVEEAIAACAASAYSSRALLYRREKKLEGKPRPAVIIQQQLEPDASGLLFTTFPDYPQELAIHAVWGFGERLMAGGAEGDEFYFLKKTGLLHRQLICKKEAALRSGGQKGLLSVPLPAARQQAPCLKDNQLQQLFEKGSLLEKEFGGPQDIEFAVKADKLYLLQCRPVTRKIPEVIVYDNSNIQESYCGVTTPLTFSFARRAYATVYRQTMEVLGIPAKTIQAHEEVVSHLLGLVKGRIYYHINNWYRGLQLLPSFSQNKEDMERMMGVEEPVDFVEDREKSLPQKLQLLPSLLFNLARLLYQFSRLPKKVPAFQARFQAFYHNFYQQNLYALGPGELISLKENLEKELLLRWTTPIINDFYVMMNNGKARRNLKKAGIGDPDEFLSRFLSGDQEIESTQPTKAMISLARKALQETALQKLIQGLPENLHAQVQQESPLFYAEVERFISQYGDRTVGELKLESHTMRTHPQIFYKYLHNLLDEEARIPESGEENGLSTRARHELSALLEKKSFLFRRRVWKSLQKLRQAIRYRESMRLERTRLFGMYRALYLAMGRRLAEAGALSDSEDVFYLEEDEILSSLHKPSYQLQSLSQSRKIEFEEYKKVEVPPRVMVPSPPLNQESAAEPLLHGRLQGAGCYPGRVTAEVIVIRDPTDKLEVKGKVVCALRTDPGWAALFPSCRAVLIEKGSSLSHSVILLRELGIPTIINIPSLTRSLQSGQKVRVDGSTGEITLLDHEENGAHPPN